MSSGGKQAEKCTPLFVLDFLLAEAPGIIVPRVQASFITAHGAGVLCTQDTTASFHYDGDEERALECNTLQLF